MSNADLYLEYDGIQQLTRKEWSSRASRLVNVIKTKVNEETYYPTVVTLISDYVQQGQTRQRNFDSKSKEYIITYQGKTFEIKNLRAFAIKNKLDQGNLCKVAQKKINSHKGYMVSYK